MESVLSIPEPHDFTATLGLSHGDHAHRYVVEFAEGHHHSHEPGGKDYQDAMSSRMRRRSSKSSPTAPSPMARSRSLAYRRTPTLSGGLHHRAGLPSIEKVRPRYCDGAGPSAPGWLSTLVAAGALAAWSLRHAEKRFGGLGSIARKLPYLSSGILTLMAFSSASRAGCT